MIMRRDKFFLCLFLGAVLQLFSASTAVALIQAHLDYGGCSMCHSFHSGTPGTPLLVALDSESLCLSCHGEASGVAVVAEVHNPLGKLASEQGYITCRECHDAHEYSGTPNKKMVGYKCDPETQYGCDNGPAITGTPPVIRVEDSTTVLSSPTFRTVTFADETADYNIDGSFPGPGVCQVCHSPNHNIGQDCTTCHPHDGGFLPSGGSCTGCHDGTDLNAPFVTYNSAHSRNPILASTGDEYTCSTCHSGHGSGTIEIPNNTAVGIDYSLNGEGGISLGSSIVTGSTEADICWNCHVTYGVSEWGVNTGGSYDYGSLHDDVSDATPGPGNHVNWTTGYWKSANYSYKDGPLDTRPVDDSADPGDNSAGRGSASIHATGGTVGTQSNALAQVSCAYCHDVHEIVSASGKPYLRGNWTPNAYPEDGAPQSGDNWADASPFSAGDNLPRALNTENGLGGYQIDQNNPTIDHSSYAYATDDSLCDQCHTTNGSSSGFVGTYPLHRNIIPGFSNDSTTVGRNLFQRSQRSSTNDRYDPWMAYFGVTDYYSPSKTPPWMGGFREVAAGNPSRDIGIAPSVDGQALAYDDFSWGITMNDTTIDVDFHSFTCSKCHSPHASRLPRLMITNCLDVQRNSWDDDYKDGATPGNPTWGNWPKLTPSTGNEGHQELAYANSAQNCHRYFPAQSGSGSGDYEGKGWNSVTPW